MLNDYLTDSQSLQSGLSTSHPLLDPSLFVMTACVNFVSISGGSTSRSDTIVALLVALTLETSVLDCPGRLVALDIFFAHMPRTRSVNAKAKNDMGP